MAENMQLVGILNTEVYRQKAISAKDGNEKAKQESRAIYMELEDSMRKASFREVLDYILKKTEGDGTALEISDYLQQHNGINNVCEVRVYNADDTKKKRAGEATEIIGLEDKVSAYIDRRQTKEGTSYDCLDMTAKFYVDCGT